LKYLKQLLVITLFSFLGEVLAYVIPLPVPAAIYGIVLLFTALITGLLRPEQVSDTAHYLISIMPLFFVVPTVKLLGYWDIIRPALIPITMILLVSTVVVFAAAGIVTQLICGKEDKKHG
jgi:holin-like protein